MCFKLRKKGNYCPLCQRCYDDNDFETMVRENQNLLSCNYVVFLLSDDGMCKMQQVDTFEMRRLV